MTSTTDAVFFKVSVLKCHLQEESHSRLIAKQVQRKSSVILRFPDYKNKTLYECVKLKKQKKNLKKLLKHISEKTSMCTFGPILHRRAEVSIDHRITEWPGSKETLKSSSSNPPAMNRDTFHYIRQLKVPPSLALITSRDGNP